MRFKVKTPEERKVIAIIEQYTPLVEAAMMQQQNQLHGFTWIDKHWILTGGPNAGKPCPYYLKYSPTAMQSFSVTGIPFHRNQDIARTIAEELVYQPHRYVTRRYVDSITREQRIRTAHASRKALLTKPRYASHN